MVKIHDIKDSNRAGDWKKLGKIIEVKKILKKSYNCLT
jgi:hypothetical protein